MQYREHLDAGERMECLEICGKAVERLRDAGGTYYLVELLEIRKQLLEDQLGELNGEEQEENLAVQREDEELLKVIRDLYRQYDVTKVKYSAAELRIASSFFFLSSISHFHH